MSIPRFFVKSDILKFELYRLLCIIALAFDGVSADAEEVIVGNLPEGYIRNVPLPRVPRDQSTFQSRVPPVHTIPVYYEETHVIPMYNSTCRIGERVA